MSARIFPREPDDRPYPSFAQTQREEAKAMARGNYDRARTLRLVKERIMRVQRATEATARPESRKALRGSGGPSVESSPESSREGER